jgi:hypothetical protein
MDTTDTREVTFLGRCRGCKAPARGTLAEERRSGTAQVRNRLGWTEERTVRSYRYPSEPGYQSFQSVRLEVMFATCACGTTVSMRRVVGTYSPDHKCGAKCRNATGPACECSCRGKHHGAGHGAVQIRLHRVSR